MAHQRFTRLRGLDAYHPELYLRLLTSSNASSAVNDGDDDVDSHAPRIADSTEGSSKFPVTVVVGIGIDVVAIILITIGVVLWRKERAISKSLVDYISFLRDSPPQTTASGGGGMSGNSGEREGALPIPSIFDSGSQNRHHHTHSSNAGRDGDSVNSNNAFESNSQHRSAGGNGSFKGSSDPTPRTVSWGSSSYFSTGMWDSVIVAARIPLDKLIVDSLISKGGYAEVYRGSYHNKQVALKRLLPDMRKNLREIEKFLSEAKLMVTLEHVRIVKFVGVGWDSLADLCVVSEYMVGGDLCGLLHQFEVEEKRPRGFDRDKVIIALHVAHLHSLDPIILHRDLKPKNILLDERMYAKVMDFGVSREQSDRTLTAGVGTLLWMVPEVIVGEKYDEKADVFSFGVVLSELDTHLMPYAHAKVSSTRRKVPDTAIIQMVSSGKIRVQFSEPTTDEDAPLDLATTTEMERLCKSCAVFDARDCPTASEVLYQLQKVLRAFDDAEEILAELRACM